MRNLDARMMALAASQFGVISRAQLLELGFTPKMIKLRVAKGILRVHYKGIYVIGGAPLSLTGEQIAGRLLLGEEAALSHRAAACYWALDGFDDEPIEFVLPGQKRRGPGRLIVHYSRYLPPCDVRDRTNVRITTVERTLVDLGAVASPRRVENALESSLYQRLTTFHRVAARVRDLRPYGLGGLTVIGKILDERDPDQAPAATIFETDFYRLLKRSTLPPAQFQYEVFDVDGFVARPDIAWPEVKVGVEAHSLRWHSPRERAKRDAARHNRLTALGWRMLYEMWDDLNRSPGKILTRCEHALREAGHPAL